MSEQQEREPAGGLQIGKEVIKRETSVVEYVNAAGASSDRARNVIIVLVVTTVLLGIEIRNTSYSWIDARIDVRNAALKAVEGGFNPVRLDEETKERIKATPCPDDDHGGLDCRARLFLVRRNYNPESAADKSRLSEELSDYRKASIEQISLVHIPFFGAVFDHNDIGMFAGVTFAVVLLWFRFSLSRELNNLNLLFNNQVLAESMKRCYDLMAMQQVLTVPRMPLAGKRHRWRWVAKVLYFIPVPVYAAQLYFDLTSVFGVGKVLGTGKMWLLVVTSLVFFGVILALTVWCQRISRAIDRVWDEAARRVYPELFEPAPKREPEPKPKPEKALEGKPREEPKAMPVTP